MSNINVRSITGKDGQPVYFPTGIVIGGSAAGVTNNIGVTGQPGFGVGVCPGPLPAGMVALTGYADPLSDNYGNYQYSDGSVMVWIPAFFYKWGSGANGLAINAISIQPLSAYSTVAAANTAGYALHRAFYDGGAVQSGVFVDKYLASNNSGVASSVKNGIPLSSAVRGSLSSSAFANLNGAPANAYYGAIVAAKTRGANFFCNSRFIFAALAMLSYAHAQDSMNKTYCAWYDAINNFPKGCNNNAIGDAQDAAILYVSDGNGTYPCGLTGSANLFARTTHNGQNCGIADLNGLLWEVTPGITSDGANIYLLKTTAQMKAVTSGNTLATDLWGATGLAALYDSLGTTYGALWATGASRSTYFGSTSQVFSEVTIGTGWGVSCAGVPLAGGIGGTNAFGNDRLDDYKPSEMCPMSGGSWSYTSSAGVWSLYLGLTRGSSYNYTGFRSSLYL